ncbi:DUF975 family protein [Paenibacillus chungangensis]|uniref:DUF975 family protein n=1 Tax=Paenibacillus chungangensis TaxID=696535 RepID=A0ABW3HT96_9BACL
MWNRKQLKDRAKDVLRTSYWKAFLASILLVIAGGGSSGVSLPSFNFDFNDDFDLGTSLSDMGSNVGGGIAAFLIGIMIVIMLGAIVISLAFRIFLGFPLEIGAMLYFKRSAEQEVNLNHLGFAFGKGRYWDTLKAMLWRALLTILWTLLFIIPGIVKSYAYSQVPFILADNPNIGYRRAVDLSNSMTRGHKFRIFVLDLSFLGWILLGLLALFVGVLFVWPYINATKAELYLELRQEALRQNIASREELRLA